MSKVVIIGGGYGGLKAVARKERWSQ